MPAHTNLSLLRFLSVWVNDSQSISIQEITDICIHNLLSLDTLIFWYLQNIFQQYKAKSYKHLWHSALQGDPTSPSSRRSVLGVHWKDWCWSWNSSTLATSCEELSHLKRPWCWEGLGAGGEGDDRGWDGWMASPTRWAWVWANSESWWWTGGPGVLWFMGSQRVGHDWATELNWTDTQGMTSLVTQQLRICHHSRRHRRRGSIPGSGRSPGGGLGSPPQYFCLENPMGRGAWRAPVHGVAEPDPTERLTQHNDRKVKHESK